MSSKGKSKRLVRRQRTIANRPLSSPYRRGAGRPSSVVRTTRPGLAWSKCSGCVDCHLVASWRFGKQIVQIESSSEHLNFTLAVSGPEVLRPVPIKFDAILIRIAQVESLAHAVVARTIELDLRSQQPAKRVGQSSPCRIEDREIVKAGCTGRRRRTAATFPRV